MEGLHLTADCFECLCPDNLLLNQQVLSDFLRQATLDAGLSIVGEHFFPFTHEDGSDAGVTGALLLAESHLAVHTWPERQAVTLDVYVCNFQNDNSEKARAIIERLILGFQAQRVSRQELHRGETSLRIVHEALSRHTSMCTQLSETLAEQRSAFQHIEIANSPEFGKLMRIDGAMMTSEKDEFFYHECLIHPAAIAHGTPKNALIIGGGDGGSSEELLKYRSLEKLTLCEIDATVIELAKQHLTSIHRNAFADPRLHVNIADGFAYLQTSNERYDLIYLDLTDPMSLLDEIGLAASCMSADFFALCREKLNVNGSLVLHLGSPVYHPERVSHTYAQLRKVFPILRPYTVFVPSYGALWGMVSASVECDPLSISEATVKQILENQQITDLQYYNPCVHSALFALPNYLKKLIA
jgi:spermidine synthase